MSDVGGFSISGPRPYNEDSYLIKEFGHASDALGGLRAFLLVCDGMGGHQGGDVASKVAVQAADRYIDDLLALAGRSTVKVDVELALREIAQEANQAVMEAARNAGGSNMGSTFIGAFVSDDEAWIGHIGDSRAYLVHRDGGRQLTVDHSQVGRMIAEGILTEEQAQHHPSRNVIERALGFGESDVEITREHLGPADVLILCTDGLSTVLTGTDMAAIVGSSPDASSAASRLTDEATRTGTDDNTTAIVWSSDWSLFRGSVPQVRSSRRAASRQRRELARHVNASRASWFAAGLVAMLVAAIWLVASWGSGGAGSAPVPAAQPPRDATSTVEATRSLDASVSAAARAGLQRYRVIGREVMLRDAWVVDRETEVGFLKRKTVFSAVIVTKADRRWYEVRPEDIDLDRVKGRANWTNAKEARIGGVSVFYIDVESNANGIKPHHSSDSQTD